MTTPQPVYVLPRDHKYHAGQFYACNDYWEWHYWSGFGRDRDGNEYALFFGSAPAGYDPATGMHAFYPNVVSISPIKEGRKAYYFGAFPKFSATHPADATSAADFQNSFGSNDGGWMAEERYYARDERWLYRMKQEKDPSQPWLDVTIGLEAPGYVSRTPTGIEEEGYNATGSFNPQTMYGLTYYYIAPRMPFKGRVGFEGRTIELEGRVWFEHQWGNVKAPDQESMRWRWFSLRFDDGRDLAFRHWVMPPDNVPNHFQNHYCLIMPNGDVEYGYPGDAIRFTALKTFTLPGSEQQWSVEGTLETPWGVYYLKTLVEDSLFISKTGMTFWEGPMSVHERSSAGKQIGLAYVEQYWQPAGGPPLMRVMKSEQPLGRERPVGGVLPGSDLPAAPKPKAKK